MKLQKGNSSERGSALISTVVVTAIIGIGLAAYLQRTSSNYLLIRHSEAWNRAMPLAEMGIEEAATQLKFQNGQNLAQNNWVSQTDLDWPRLSASGTFYTMHRSLTNDYYNVAISSTDPVIIYAQGYAQIPGKTNFVNRIVRVTMKRTGLFLKAMSAKGSIKLSGDVNVDSWNSADPSLNTNGQYDPTKVSDKGDVATDGQVITTSGNVKIKGHISTGPGGDVSTSGGVSIGSEDWVAGGNTGVQTGWSTDDMNVDFPLDPPPFTSAFAPTPGKVDGTNYTYVLYDGNYELSSINLSSSSQILVKGNAVLLVDGNVKLSGQSSIVVAPGASLDLYVAGSECDLGGGGIVNKGGNAQNFVVHGLEGCTEVAYSGSATFIGVIYAPNAELKVSGGSTIIGATVSNTVSGSGGFDLHYDENLANFRPGQFVMSSWNEL